MEVFAVSRQEKRLRFTEVTNRIPTDAKNRLQL